MKFNRQFIENNMFYGENSHERNRPFFRTASGPAPLLMPGVGKIWGLDLSHWNTPPVDLKRMKELYNLRFVIIKGCDGSLRSKYFDEHRANAISCGLPWGIYDWIYPANKVDLDSQTQSWSDQAAEIPPPLGVFIDCEWTYYAGQPANPTTADLRNAHDLFRLKSGHPAATYTSAGYANGYLTGFDFTRESLWVANYDVLVPTLPTGANTYQYWQFGLLDGHQLDPTGNAELDGNYFHGTEAEFIQLTGGTPPPDNGGSPMTSRYTGKISSTTPSGNPLSALSMRLTPQVPSDNANFLKSFPAGTTFEGDKIVPDDLGYKYPDGTLRQWMHITMLNNMPATGYMAAAYLEYTDSQAPGPVIPATIEDTIVLKDDQGNTLATYTGTLNQQ